MTGRHARPRPPEGLSARVLVLGVAVVVVLVVLAGALVIPRTAAASWWQAHPVEPF